MPYEKKNVFVYCAFLVFTGRYENDVRVSGKMIYANGDVYEGLFKGDIRHGKGTMTSAKGDVYHGSFENGLKNGIGTLKHTNGDVYEVNNDAYLMDIFYLWIVRLIFPNFISYHIVCVLQGNFKDGHYARPTMVQKYSTEVTIVQRCSSGARFRDGVRATVARGCRARQRRPRQA